MIYIFIFWICAQSLSQVQVKVSTDHTAYYQGDTINITVMAANLSPDPITLNFPSPCQANYCIDHNWKVVCIMVMQPTQKIIPANSLVGWNFSYPTIFKHNTIDSLSVGSHVIGGRVNGYGEDELIINVLPNLSTSNRADHLIPDLNIGNNYPNPFKEVTWIPVNLASPCNIIIDIFNSIGQYICSFTKDFTTPGKHLIRVELSNSPGGIYWCRLSTGGKIKTIKLLLMGDPL